MVKVLCSGSSIVSPNMSLLLCRNGGTEMVQVLDTEWIRPSVLHLRATLRPSRLTAAEPSSSGCKGRFTGSLFSKAGDFIYLQLDFGTSGTERKS